MATCPHCGNSSHKNPDSMVVEEVIDLKPGTMRVEERADGTIQQPVFDGVPKARLSCKKCGWSIFGRMEGEYFVVYPGDNDGTP